MNNKLRKPFNNRVVSVKLVPKWRKREPKTLTLRHPLYQKMIRDHGCNNSSTSYMPFPAMYNCTTVYTLKCFKADGTPKKDYVGSLKDIMEAFKWKGNQIFSMVAHIGDGIIAVFFQCGERHRGTGVSMGHERSSSSILEPYKTRSTR